jgi:hypothetical protein
MAAIAVAARGGRCPGRSTGGLGSEQLDVAAAEVVVAAGGASPQPAADHAGLIRSSTRSLRAARGRLGHLASVVDSPFLEFDLTPAAARSLALHLLAEADRGDLLRGGDGTVVGFN